MTDIIIEEQKLKRCSQCGELKHLSEFHKKSHSKDGHRSECIPCRAKRVSMARFISRYSYELLPEFKLWWFPIWDTGSKTCTHCHIEKDISEFFRSKRTRDGYDDNCKKCNLSNNKRWRENNIEYTKKYGKIWRENNQDIVKRNHDNWYQNNKEHIKEQTKIWCNSHKKERRLICINYWHKRRSHIDNTNEKQKITMPEWKHILDLQNNTCATCGRKFTRKLKPTMDHIVPLSKGGEHTSANIQALCQSCNSSKNARICKQYIQSWSLVGEQC
jgi:hypothetical protein